MIANLKIFAVVLVAMLIASPVFANPPSGQWYGKPDRTGRGCGEPTYTKLEGTFSNGQFAFVYGDEANDDRRFTVRFSGNRAPEDWFSWSVWNKYGSKWDLHTANISGEYNGRGIRLRFYSPFMGDRLGCNYYIYFVPSPAALEMSVDELVEVYKGERIINPAYATTRQKATIKTDQSSTSVPAASQSSTVKRAASTEREEESIEDRLATVASLLEKGLITAEEASQKRKDILKDF